MKRRNMSKSKQQFNHNNGIPTSLPSTPSTTQEQLRKEEIDNLVLWKSPFKTLYYFFLELIEQIKNCLHQLVVYKKYLLLVLFLSLLYTYLNQLQGSHQPLIQQCNKQVLWSLYWLGLGILSSIGLGTGLHTFLLYLGPHIAAVTLAAFECRSLNFLEPPYPNEILCSDEGVDGDGVSVWEIMAKVRWECFMWGTGTAIGELPPYFMARASRLHGEVNEEEDEMKEILRSGPKTWLERGKVFMHETVNRFGFVGILLCASIPNPLFDLAGITCGHFLIPFWTFFGATLIGKALIKMHIQIIFVIFLFSQDHVQTALTLFQKIPWAGLKFKVLVEDFLLKQKQKMHNKMTQEENWLSWVIGKIVMVMVAYFLVSIVTSMAQSYRKKMQQKENNS